MDSKTKKVMIIGGILLTGLILITTRKAAGAIELNYFGKPGMLPPDNPRGVRNNNPGNIRISYTTFWKGKVPVINNTDNSFEQFKTYEHGIRALIILLRNYIKGGNDTVRKIITKYAPSNENNTEAYIQAVAKETTFAPDQKIGFYSIGKALLLTRAIIRHENGGDYMSKEQFARAWQMI